MSLTSFFRITPPTRAPLRVRFRCRLGAVPGLFQLDHRGPLISKADRLGGLLGELVHDREEHGRRAGVRLNCLAGPIDLGGHLCQLLGDRGHVRMLGRTETGG